MKNGGGGKFILAIILTTVLLIGGGAVLALRSSGTVNVEADAGAKVAVENSSVEWGEIKMDKGIVEARFTIKNEGNKALKLFNATTSCACTKGKIKTAQKESGYFGMHNKSNTVMEVLPGETAEVIAEFDPAFHGPSGVGPINRQVTMTTNDPSKPQLDFLMNGTVVRD